MTAKVAVIRFPGSNCESESLRAVHRVGLGGAIVRWNESVERLREFNAYILPGGFSYQDRIRAGAVAARLPLLDLLEARADQGAPILGLCNGAQILAEAGLVPGGGGAISFALAPNQMKKRSGYYTRWIHLAPGPAADRCLFTNSDAHDYDQPIPIPMAHAEGRFVAGDEAHSRILAGLGCLCYANPDGTNGDLFPWNPNGSQDAIAGVTNKAGNVLALMPHPERAQILAQVPESIPGVWGEKRRAARGAADLETDGPGLALFRSLARHLGVERR